jgi:hypothetical protein
VVLRGEKGGWCGEGVGVLAQGVRREIGRKRGVGMCGGAGRGVVDNGGILR